MPDPVNRLSTDALTAEEIADAVWLAARIAAVEPAHQAPETPRERSTPPAAEAQEPAPVDSAPTPPPQPEPAVARHAPAPALLPEPPADEPRSTHWTWSVLPDLPPNLPKALRPLNRLVPSLRDWEVDEEETAVRAAESRLWLPVPRPSPERPFEVVVVIDRGSSMRLWRRTTSAFATLLAHQGAFTDVRVVSVNTDERNVESVETVPGVTCTPEQLADPTGRRIIIVMSDCAGAAWRSGSMKSLMATWARTCHVALVHLLAHERWSWTGIRVVPKTLHGVRPGAAASIPVLALDHRHLRRWAELMTGAARVRLPVLVLTPAELPERAPDVVPAEERLHRFEAAATPQAARLAGLLAAAPLKLRVMQAVQGALMPGSRHEHLAEVLLSGLMHQVAALPDDARPPVEYEFEAGLRRRLLTRVSRNDTAQVQRVVEDVLSVEEPSVAGLRGVLTKPDTTALPDIDTRARSLVAVQYEVLRAMSGPYGARAKKLDDALISGLAPKNPEHLPRGSDIDFQRAVEGTRSALGGDTGRPPVLNDVPNRNMNFAGRADLLDSLHTGLTNSATSPAAAAILGMGGIGKSQIAVEYIYRHAHEYDLIWWVPSANPSEIQVTLVQLSQQLGLPVRQSVDTAIPAVLKALATGEPCPRWLLVFDNADHLDYVREFWPRHGDGHILVTSRNLDWAEVAHAIEVDVFHRPESRELLQRRNADLSDENADRLASALGDLPLALEPAAAWLASTGMSVDDYLRFFERERATIGETHALAQDYEAVIQAAWNVSLTRLRAENPGALELLEACAFFSPEPISWEIFSGVRNLPVSDTLGRVLAHQLEFNRAIRGIRRYSLARIDHRNSTIQLHRVVQLVLRNKLGQEAQENIRHTVHLLLAHGDPKAPNAVKNWPRYAELLPHLRAVHAHDCADRWVRGMMINAVHYLFAFGDPVGSLQMAHDVAREWREKFGESDPDTLVMSRWWGRTLRAIGRFEEGRAVAERTLELMTETLGRTHEDTLLTMHGVASDLRAKGDFVRASRMNEFAYRTAVDEFGENDPDTLAAANNYALSLRLVGEVRSALVLDQDTWERKRFVLGDEHRQTLLTLDNLAVDLRETGDYLGAYEMQAKAVRHMRAQLGDQHPMTLSTIKNLATAHRRAGKTPWGEALTLAGEAMTGLVAKYGESHPDAMSAALDLSIEHRQHGNLTEARRLGERVKELYETTWGAHHPFSLAATTNLAVTLRQLGQVAEARALNEQVMTDMRATIGPDHPFSLVCATNYASDLAASAEYEAAYALDDDTAVRSRRVLGADHPSTLAVLVNQTLDLRGLGRAAEADELKQAVIRRLGAVLGDDHPATTEARLNHRADCDIDTMQI